MQNPFKRGLRKKLDFIALFPKPFLFGSKFGYCCTLAQPVSCKSALAFFFLFFFFDEKIEGLPSSAMLKLDRGGIRI